MQDLAYLTKQGYSQEAMKKKFTAQPRDPKIERLTELHSARLRRAIRTTIEEAPLYGAIDRVLEATQKNVPYIQARELAESGKSHAEIMAAFKHFGLDRMLEPAIDPVTGQEIRNPKDNQPLLTFNKPIFENVFVPLVTSYCDIRVAKLFNDRNQFPRYKVSPPRVTMKDMVVSDILTSRLSRMSQDMGYADDDKQSLKQMAYYGICFNFPKESYYRQEYKTAKGVKTGREGVRFAIPHPRRHFWDRSAPLYTFNSDTGTNYAGYWDIQRWDDVQRNPLYWNQEFITQGGYAFFLTPAWRIAETFYPCVIAVPKSFQMPEVGQDYDRIEKEPLLLQDQKDQAVITAVLFDKLNPKEYGLFDYDYPCWMRFIYCNVDTCIHCEVIPYTPGFVYLDRYDANKTVASSLALQLAPFQQLLGNFLTQHFHSVKENLFRVAFVNEDIVPGEQVKLLRKLKDKLYQGIQFLGYSKKKDQFMDADRREAISTLSTPQVDTQQTLSNINMTLMAVERMLGFSPQEVGSPASHEQTAQEVNIAANSTGVSLEFMGHGVDRAIDTKVRICCTAFMCYGDDEVFAEVADLTPERRKALEDLGFKIDEGHKDGDIKFGVSGSKDKLVLEHYVSERQGVNRLNDSKLGIAMLQSLGQAIQNPVLFQLAGPQQVLELFNYVWRVIGMPDDYRLRPVNLAQMNQQDQQKQLLEMLAKAKEMIVQQAVQVVEQQMKQSVIEPMSKEFMELAQQLKGMQAGDAQMQQVLMQLVPVVKALEAFAQRATQGPPPMPMGGPGGPPPGMLMGGGGPPPPPMPPQLPPGMTPGMMQELEMRQNLANPLANGPVPPPPPGVIPIPPGQAG